jgi:hypothetical protein
MNVFSWFYLFKSCIGLRDVLFTGSVDSCLRVNTTRITRSTHTCHSIFDARWYKNKRASQLPSFFPPERKEMVSVSRSPHCIIYSVEANRSLYQRKTRSNLPQPWVSKPHQHVDELANAIVSNLLYFLFSLGARASKRFDKTLLLSSYRTSY